MTTDKFSNALGDISEKYVDEAAGFTVGKKRLRIKCGSFIAAACFVLAVGGYIMFPYHKAGSIISDYNKGGYTSGCYATPEPGEYFCFIEVEKAREAYADREVLFLLAFDIFAEAEVEITRQDLYAEYQRLADLGYKLYYIEDHWTYRANMQKEYVPVVVGLFSEKQLSNFDVNPKYGYAFHFETNGDGTPVSVDEDNVITDFTSNIK